MNAAAVVIRRMRLADLPAVIAIDRDSFTLPWSERSFAFEIEKNRDSRPYVAERLDAQGAPEIVGMLVAWMILDEVHIATLAVRSDCRRQGIARELLRHALQMALAEGGLKAMLEVRRSNQAALALYREFGFVEVGVRRRYYKDNNEDALQLDLEPIAMVE
ncbi:MAG: ribosomal protein S18-alanine N-acetyltransferase [Anaerolineae bacterium]|nr:ribosomal protein S18-alanine N-acetyltransferase [Anaerolineae bacterium]